MAVGDFDRYYSDEPFSVMNQNQQTWLDPDLIDIWRQRSVFRPLITYQANLGDVRATSMTRTMVFDAHPDFSPLSARQMWLPSMHIDSQSVEITFAHYGGKIAYHKYDDMVTYWRKNGKAGMRQIARGTLGQNEVDVNDLLARNALIVGSLTTGYNLFSSGSSTVNFSGIATGDLYDPDLGADIWLGMINRGVPGTMGPSGAEGSIVCYTTPGVIFDTMKNPDWISVRQYADPKILMRYEAGAIRDVRYVQTPKCMLWNCGTILARAPINAVLKAEDGAPNPATTKVDGTYKVGQTSAGVIHYVSLGAFTTGTIATLAVNDMITLHKTVTSTYGVTDGVDFNEGTAVTRRIVAIDSGNGRIVLDKPVMLEFDEDLGSGTYGYITKGRHIHASIFVGGPNAIAAGVAQQPQFYNIDPIDDFKAIFRFSWDQYLGYQTFQPEVSEVVFSAGSFRVKGPTKVQ
jgi:hypothetical protein